MVIANRKAIPVDTGDLIERVILNILDAAFKGTRLKRIKWAVEDVRGRVLQIEVVIERVNRQGTFNLMVHGGSYSDVTRELKLLVHFPSIKKKFPLDSEKAAQQLVFEVNETLVHELTHVRDVIQRSDIHQVRKRRGRLVGDASEYFNSPHEVRAYARNLADYVARQYGRELREMSGAEIYKKIRAVGIMRFYFERLTPENQRKTVEIVVGELHSRGLID